LNICAQTHIGMVRKKNEDRYIVKEMSNDSVLLMVADGMGGEVAGDAAAEIMRATLDGIEKKSNDVEKQLICFIEDANRLILNKVKKNSRLLGMGTTVTCAFVGKSVLHWAHVGDSRLYILRGKKLLQVTEDQTMAQFLIDEGKITEEEARNHPASNHLDQCVGCKYCKPETGTLEIERKDLLLLATDGLHGELSAEAITFLLSSPVDIETKAKSLINSANDAGGKDNITIVIAET
jgi:serine/threonine protein phosphatase PrpC